MSSADSFIAAADTAQMEAGGTSVFEDVGNVLTKGVAGAVVSGWHGIYNTGVDFSNKLFDAGLDRADTLDTLNKVSEDYGDYYKAHQGVIDTAGFFAGSLIPGTLAVKGLKAVSVAGESAGVFGRVLGYAANKERFYLDAALKDLSVEGGTVFTRINANKALSMAWGTADSTLQVAAFETATAMSMKASPMLDAEDWKTIGWDITKTSLFGGAIGGGLNAIFTNKLVKDAGRLVEGKQRMYDILKDTGNTDLSYGDRAYQIIDAIDQLPKDITNPVVKLNHGKEGVIDSLDLTGLLERTKQQSVIRGVQKFESTLNAVVENDKSVGAALAKSLVDFYKDAVEAGRGTQEVRTKLGDLLWNLKGVEGLNNKTTAFADKIEWFDPNAKVAGKVALSPTKMEGGIPYRAIRDAEPTMAVLGKDALLPDDAFKRGFDFVLDPTTQRVVINPKSTIYEKVKDGDVNTASLFYNSFTRQTSADAVATIGDVGPEVVRNFAGIQNGSKTYQFSPNSYNIPKDAVEATARHAWAWGLRNVNGAVESGDISLLDALLRPATKELPAINTGDLTIINTAERSSVQWSDVLDKEAFVFKNKMEYVKRLLQESEKPDLREIAYRANVTEDWLENAITNRFGYRDNFNVKGWQQDPERFMGRENLVFRYDKSGMEAAGNSPEGITAYYTRVKESTIRAQDAAASILGDGYSNLISLEGSLAGDASAAGGVGAGFFTASNAGYGDRLKAWAQYTGQQVANLVNGRTSAALAVFQSPAAKALQSSKAMADLTGAVAQGRLSSETWGLWNDPLTNKFMMVDLESLKKVKEGGKIEFAKRIPLEDGAGEVIQTWHNLHMMRVDQQNALAAAQGFATKWDRDRLYFPPVDTQRVPFFAFVRQNNGSVFGSSEVAMITARDAGELQRLASQVEKKPGFQVVYKSNSEDYHKAKRDYDFSRAMNQPVIDSTLRKEGLLGDYLPNFTPESTLEDMTNFILRSETKIVRDAVTVNYGQTFAELADLSSRYTAAQTSKFEGLNKLLQRTVTDPFDDATKLALNISKRSEFTLWHEANEFVDAVGTRAFRGIEKAVIDARGGKITWREANDTLAKFGLGSPFPDDIAFQVAQHANDRNLLKTALTKANAIVAAGMLRLDFANSLLNVVSTPILLGTEVAAIRNSVRKDPELFARLNEMTSVAVPGVSQQGGVPFTVPSTLKLLYNAVGDLVSPNGKELMSRFRAIGTVKGPAALYHQMIDDLSLTPKLVPSEYAAKVEKWVEQGAKWTGNNLAEDYTRFVTSHVMWQITKPLVEAGRMTEQEANAFISIFTNRVQGNYVAAQRPIAFQGTLGSAVGLFQTYQFNLLQQLYRHIENKDAKTLAVMGGLQGTLFGANGLPFFQAVNTQIVGNASINQKHEDAYSYAVRAGGKDFGDWLMYGTASAFPLFSEQAPALWTRGDLNPRSVFVLPTSPQDVPAVQAGIKVVGAILGMAKQVSKGADVKDALLFGLEHNGINRPLAGLAQVVGGQSTTSQGNLVSAAGDWNSIATFSRLIGAKPMDESIALNTLYRSRAYQAVDKERIDDLGSVVKQKLRNNQSISSNDWTDLQGQYIAGGGRIQGFTQAIRRWDKAANTSLVNEVMRHSQTAAGQRMIESMGGDPLRDYRNTTGEENP
jgi:hypothetical protein